MANQNFRVKKGIEVGLGATFLYADDSGVGINSTSPRSNLDVRGRAQTEELLVDNYAEIVGPSTFVGLGTFKDDLYVGNDLYVKGNLTFTSFEAETGNVTGVLTTRDFNVTGLSTFQGDATFQSNVSISTDLSVSGDSTFTGNVVVSGASTLTGIVTTGDDLYVGGSLYVGNDIFYDEITGRNLSISGVATVRQLEIQQDLEVAGLSTFVGLVSFRDAVGTGLTVHNITSKTGEFEQINVTGDGGGGGGTGIDSTSVNTQDLNVTGTATINSGIITNLNAEYILAGVTTTTELYFNTGLGTALTVENLNVTGIATLKGVGIATLGGDPVFNSITVTGVSSLTGDVSIGAALTVSGDSFFSGVGTFASDLTVLGNFELDGNLNVKDITARNVNVTGITTSTVSITTSLAAEEASIGIVTVTNFLADSKGQVGYGQSILVTEGGKLLWTRADVAGIATSFQPGSTFYVAENGSNANDGLSPEKAWKSIAYALSQIGDTNHDILEIGAGEYIETFPLTVPKGLTIQGAGQRATLIKPSQATETNDGFLLNDRSTVQDLTIRGFYKPVGTQNYAFKLAVGAALTQRSPYIDRVTLLNQGTNTTADDPYGYNSADSYPTQAPGGGGVLIDGQVVTTDSPYASILANELTLFTPGSRGIEITNGGRMEWLNGFVYFASEAVVGVSDKSTGLAGQGKTRLTLDSATGGVTGGNTIEYYDSDGTTVLASGTIDNVSGSYVTLTNSGVGTFAVPRNRTAKTVNFIGTAQLSTAQAKFGVSSLDLTGAGTDEITVDSHQDFGFGTGDFTIEFWIYRTGNITGKIFYDNRDNADADSAISITGNGGNETDVYIGTTSIISGTVTTTLNGWNHIAVVRSGSTITQYIDGVVSGTPATAANDLGSSRKLSLGDKYDGSNSGPTGYFDELRITKGAAKYTGAFTPPSSALVGDKDTSILLHFDGTNGATTTTDDIIVYQDIRITGGNTADRVTLADYSQFGADLRSIACAIEYGNQGMIGNGDGVTLRAISMNFNHVGSLGDFSNDPNLAVQANEVIELNGGEVSYVSIDQKGDFRVGEAFYVNQETGEVSFTDTVTDLTALSSLTITDGTNSSVITPTSGRFGNVLISGQSLESVTGDLDIKTGGAGEVNIYGNTNVIGILTAQIIEINAIQRGDTAIALDDTGTDGTIRFITDGQEAQRITNQQRVGINTTTPVTQLEVKGGTQLENLNVVGVATLNGTGIATIGGDPDFRNLNVTGVSTFAGVGTFGSDLYVAGNLNVVGDIVYDEVTGRNLNIAGIATINKADLTDVSVGSALTNTGHTQLNTLNVSGVSALNSDLSVGGATTLSSDLSVGGELDVTGNSVFTGISTFNNDVTINGDLTINGTQEVDSFKTTDLTVTGIASINQAKIATGIVTTLTATRTESAELRVTGLSTFVGVATFSNDVYVAGNLNVVGDIVYDEVTGRNLNISGIATIGHADITDATVGVATIQTLNVSDINVDGGTGIDDNSVVTENLVVSGIATINSGILTTLQAEVGSVTDLTVGVSTFTGIATFQSDVYTSSDLYVSNDLYVDGNLNVVGDITYDEVNGRNLNISGIATIGYSSITDANIGVATISLADVSVGNVTDLTAGVSTFTGIATFQSDLYVAGDLNVLGDITYDEVSGRNLNISGVATIGFASLTDLRVSGVATFLGDVQIDGAQIVDALQTGDLEVTGVTTTTELRFTDAVGTGLTLTNLVVTGDAQLNGSGIVTAGSDINFRNLEVAGLSTFVGLQSFRSAVGTALTIYNLRVPENGIVSLPGIPVQGGDAEFRNVNVTGVSSFVGVATFQDDLYVEGNLNVTGDIVYDEVTGRNINISGVGTIRELNSDVATITDLQAGVSTFTDDVFISGNLNVTGDIVYDEVSGRNLNISGIATIGHADITDATVGVATISTLTFGDGVGTGLTLTNLVVTGDAQLNGSGIVTAGQDINFRNLSITGLSTFVGVATFQDDLYVAGNLNVVGDIVYDEVTGRNLNISGVATIGYADITDATIGVITTTRLDSDDFISIGSSLIPDSHDVYDLGSTTIGYRDVYGRSLRTDEDFIILQANEGVDIVDENGTSIVTVNKSLNRTLFETDVDAKKINASEEVTVTRSSDTDLAFVAKVGTTTNFSVTAGGDITARDITSEFINADDINIGVTTTTELRFTDAVGTGLTLTNLTVTGDAQLNGSGIVTAGQDINFRNLSITGLSTFAGIATFQDDLYVGGNLNVVGDIVYDEVTGRNLNISGIATIGTADITNLTVSGVTTFQGPVNIDGGQLTDFIQTKDLIVTGVATIGYATITKLYVDHGDMRNLNVSGVATIGSIISDPNGTLVVEGAAVISGIVTIGDNSIVIDGRKDVEAIYLGDTGRAVVSGITTNGVRTYVNFDDGRFDRLNVTGISTFNDVVSTSSTITNLDVTTATVGFLTATQGYVGVLTVGTIDSGSDIGADITTRNLSVTGVSTFAGISTFQSDLYVSSDLYVDGNLNVVGDISYDEVSGRNLNISGIATIGFSSLTDLRVSGVATFLGDVNISGVTSVTTLEATNIDTYQIDARRLVVPDGGFVQLPGIPVSGGSAEFSELSVTGIATISGVATFSSDVYIDGDFYVGGAQVIDDVQSTNITVSGVATIGTADITVLEAEDANIGFLTVSEGYIGILTAQNYTSLSDERLKSDIEPIDDALEGVLRLDGVRFVWNETGTTDMGVIAQQVESVFPDIVTGDTKKGVNYNGLIGVLIEAVKELKDENDNLRERIERLEGR